jgi:hypothetical protein
MYWRDTPEESTNSAVESVLETSVSKFSLEFCPVFRGFWAIFDRQLWNLET